MRRWLALALTLACGVAEAQPLTGGLLGRGGSYSAIPAPTGCASTEMTYFLGSPAVLTCLDRVYWTAATRSLDVTDGRVQAANLTATGLATPGAITVTPTLTMVGSITTVAGSALVDGDGFVIKYTPAGTVPLEFDLSPGNGTTGGAIPILFTAGDSADLIRDNVILALNAAAPAALTASSGGAATVALTLDVAGVTGGTNIEAVANAGWAVTGFANPTAATTYTYKLVARLADGSTTEAGAASTTAAGHATLSAANYNALSWSAVTNAVAYDVYKTVGGTTGKIAAATTALALNDTGLAGAGETPPTVDTTGLLKGDGLRVGTSTTPGFVLTGDANGYYTPQAAGGLSGLTAGRVTLSTAATTVGDDAGLLFDGTNNRLSIVGGLPATDGTIPALGITATLPASPSAAVSGVNVTVTSAGSAAQTQSAASITLAAGHSADTANYGLRVVNKADGGSGQTTLANARVGIYGEGYSGGYNSTVGVYGKTVLGARGAAGVVGYAYGASRGSAGVVGYGNGTTYGMAGFFKLTADAEAESFESTFQQKGALVADNGSVAAPIALFRDNGVTKVSIEDGGTLQFASPGITGGLTKTLTDASATNFATVTLGDGTTSAGEVLYRVAVTDGTSRQVFAGRFRYSTTRVGTDYDADGNEVGTQILSQKPDGGTLTCTLAGAAAGGVLTLSANCDSSLTTPVLTLNYRFDTTSTAVITPL